MLVLKLQLDGVTNALFNEILIIILRDNNDKYIFFKARIGLEIEIEIGLEFNHSEERKPISSLCEFCFGWSNFNLISISNLIRGYVRFKFQIIIEIKLEFNQSK